jgi:hypothetical protein
MLLLELMETRSRAARSLPRLVPPLGGSDPFARFAFHSNRIADLFFNECLREKWSFTGN